MTRLKGSLAKVEGSLVKVEGEVTRPRGSLAKVEGEATRPKGLLAQAKEKASLSEHMSLKAATMAIEAFRKGEDFYQELLESCNDAFAKGIHWCKWEVMKCYPEVDLGELSSGVSSFGNDLDSFKTDESGKATLPP